MRQIERGFAGPIRQCLALATLLLSVLGAHADEARLNGAPRTIGDITALLDQYKPDPGKAAEVRRVLDQPIPETKDSKELARFYKQKAVAANDVGAARENVSRAEALRQSMLSLMQQNSDSFAYAHPLFWAPYALVGDGGK